MATNAICDSHVHCEYSYDGHDTVTDNCRHAVEHGLTVLTLTDHCDMRSHRHGYTSYFPSAERRWNEIEAAKKAFPELTLLNGVEMGDVSNDFDLAQAHLEQYDYDFVLGSVHHIRDDKKKRFDDMCTDDLLSAYFDEMDALVAFGNFDSLAHLDYPAKLWNVPDSAFIRFEERIDAILKRIIEKDIAIEINSSGLFHAVGKAGPQLWVLEHYKAFGGTMITLGSDSHRASDIGRGLDKARELARAAGFDHVVYFEKRKPVDAWI
ncbi:MAG: Histidinol-phosphatase [Spirochaetes bacterium ADurb.Bin315]|jgi:histidinol-phosphatase (PHP family)|nr:MAG: Histidinol-phosphatase [Spirochaetes bacterium ADurb.Bin315]